MPHPFDAESPHRGQLTVLVSRAVDIDARIRALQAARAVVFAAAHDLAEQEGTRDASGSREASHGVSFEPASTSRIPRGLVARRDRAHRVIDGSDLTVEAAIAKLGFLIDRGVSGSDLRALMETNLVGECAGR